VRKEIQSQVNRRIQQSAYTGQYCPGYMLAAAGASVAYIAYTPAPVLTVLTPTWNMNGFLGI